jgi:hypothetical protein
MALEGWPCSLARVQAGWPGLSSKKLKFKKGRETKGNYKGCVVSKDDWNFLHCFPAGKGV